MTAPASFLDAQTQLEDALLELRAFAVVAQQLAPEHYPAQPELDEVTWPFLLGRLAGRADVALANYLDLVRLLLPSKQHPSSEASLDRAMAQDVRPELRP